MFLFAWSRFCLILLIVVLNLGNAIQTVKSSASVKVLTVRGTSFEAASVGGGNASVEKGTLCPANCVKVQVGQNHKIQPL